MNDAAQGGLPPKLYFRIGEVAELVGVEPHVLRYWEREFRSIRPTKSAKGQRVYSRRDVENLMRVRELLYREGFTIAGVGDMSLENIDQPDLKITVAGAGNVAASGNVKRLELQVAGASDAKLAGLAVDRVAVHIAGSSQIDVAPKDDLEANIVGSGTVMLHSEPKNIETHIIGSGRIIHPDGSVSGNNRHI